MLNDIKLQNHHQKPLWAAGIFIFENEFLIFNKHENKLVTFVDTEPKSHIPLEYSHAVIIDNKIHLLGGCGKKYIISTIYSGTINTNGTLGSWTAEAALPEPMTFSEIINTKDRIYLIGGFNGYYYLSTIYSAPINENGTLGEWVKEQPLPGPARLTQSITIKDRMYLLGGSNIDLTTLEVKRFNIVYSSRINENGTLGEWLEEPPLPLGLDYMNFEITENRIKILNGSTDNGKLNKILAVDIKENGRLGKWEYIH